MNTTTIKLGGHDLELRASNYASQLYSEEFFGMERGEYNGNLSHDTMQLVSDCFGDVREDGTVSVKLVPPTLWGIVWALAAAAGSVNTGYRAWLKSVRDEIWTVEEQSVACVEVVDLVTEAFFRESSEQGGEVA